LAPINTNKSMRNYQLAGLLGLIIVAGGIGAWSMMSSIRGAIIAPGVMIIEGYSKKVQHSIGGIVTKIAIKDGDRVEAGDLLIALDETEISAQLSILDGLIAENLAKAARLKVMRDGGENITFPDEVLSQKNNPRVAEIIADQQNLLKALQDARKGRAAQLQERISQTHEEVTGLESQLQARQEQSELIAKELAAVKALFDKGLVTTSRLLTLQRERAKLLGTQGELVAKVARARGQISEINLQIIQLKDDDRSKVLNELRQVESKLTELQERRVALRVKLKRAVVRAPQTGFVHQLTTHTIGGVIGAGEVIMLIVPDFNDLVVEARVKPQDINQIAVDQPARIRFSAFAQRTTPEIAGKVSFVSADLAQSDPNTPPYYSIKIELSQEELKKLGDKKIIPGMPAEAFIQTAARTPMNYLLKPLRDQIMRAFREE